MIYFIKYKTAIIKILTIFIAVFIASSVFSQTGIIRGFVYEKETGEPIIFTNVYLYKTIYGAPTNVDGLFVISKIPAGTYTLMVTNLGFDTLRLPVTLKTGQMLHKKLYLSKSSYLLPEIQIFADKQAAKTETKTSVVKVTPKQIKQIPSIGSQPDLAQYLQVLPGVVFTGDQGGQLYIRGGSPVQNKVMLDGMIIYNPFHSIGLFSIFDTEILRNADIYTGGFGAEYGGRISSVMDITTRDGNKKRFAGKVGLSNFGANILFEGPIKKQKEDGKGSSSFIFSAKNSYLKESSKIFYEYIDEDGLPFNYTDIYSKLSFNSNKGSKVSFFGFKYTDDVNYKTLSDFHWDATGGGTKFIVLPGASAAIIDGNFAYSTYKITLDAENSPPRSSEVKGFNMGLNFTYFLGKNQVKYGIEMLGFNTNFEFHNIDERVINQEEHTTELAGYLKTKIIKGKLILEPSFRAHYYASLSNFSPEPRLAIKYNIADVLRIKFAGGYYSQNLIAANSDRDVVNLFYGFVSGPENLQDEFDGEELTHKLQKSQHLILGIEYDLFKYMSINIEGYYKNFSQLTNINRNKVFNDSPEYSDKPDYLKKDFIVETGNAKGIDVLLKYDYKRIYVWAVYSLSKIDKYDGVVEYVPHYDRRHNVNLIVSYIFGKKLNSVFNVRWNYGSGFPFTQTQGFYEKLIFEDGINTDYTKTNGDIGIQYGELNQGRLSDYHRLDVSVKQKFEISSNSTLEATLSITNVYDTKNIFYVERLTNKRVYQLPFMPSIGLNYKF